MDDDDQLAQALSPRCAMLIRCVKAAHPPVIIDPAGGHIEGWPSGWLMPTSPELASLSAIVATRPTINGTELFLTPLGTQIARRLSQPTT